MGAVRDALDAATARLAGAGVENPALDAELLVRHVLGWDRATLFTRDREPLGPADDAAIEHLVRARETRRPLQHLTGSQAFWRHDFVVSGDVLIPRPETELVVEAALEVLRGRLAPRIVDVGTGSGIIALCLAADRPDAEVHATDISQAALAVARQNARRLGLTSVRFHQGDLLAALAGSEEPGFDLVASNPPYVGADEVAGLAPEVRDHEPRLALVPPGGRALAMYERLAPQAAAVLRRDGHLVVEVGLGQHEAVAEIVRDAGLTVIQVLNDLQGIPRTLHARRP